MWIPKFKVGDVVILRKPFGSGVQVSSAEGRGNIWIPDIMDKFNNGVYEVECANEKSYRLKGMNLAIDEDWLVLNSKAPELKPLSKAENSAVDHPRHYTSHPSGIEAIEICRHDNFNCGNAMKYIFRRGKKDDEIQDLKKAIWYLNDEVKRLEAIKAKPQKKE